MYNVMSPKAEEFISDEEIRECLDYAQKNKRNAPQIDEILNKARKMQGLSHKEAIVLLDCELEDKNQERNHKYFKGIGKTRICFALCMGIFMYFLSTI